MISILICIIIIIIVLCVIFCEQKEYFDDIFFTGTSFSGLTTGRPLHRNLTSNNENIFAFNPYVNSNEQVKDKFILPINTYTGDIHKWEKRFPYLVKQRYTMNDQNDNSYNDNSYNDYVFKESTYSLKDKALLTELPLQLSPKWTDKDFIDSKYYYDKYDVCSKKINNFDEKYKNYGVVNEKNLKYKVYEPTYFDYLDIIY